MLSQMRIRGPIRVLAVSDSAVLGRAIVLTLFHGTLFARLESDPLRVAETASEWRPHLAVCDVHSQSGSAFLAWNRRSRQPGRVPVICVMARDDLKGRLALFADGADDVLSAPYDPAELLARVMAVLHRSYRQEPVMKPVIEVDGMVIDIMNRTVTLPGHEAHLTAVELAILYLMAASPGAVLSRSDIAAHVWGPAHVTESNIIDRHIRNLRVKLNNSWREPRYIFTLPGQGYRFGREQGQQSPGDQRPE